MKALDRDVPLGTSSVPVCQRLSKAYSENNPIASTLLFPFITFSRGSLNRYMQSHTTSGQSRLQVVLRSELVVLAANPQPWQLREQQLTRNQCDILCLWRRKG